MRKIVAGLFVSLDGVVEAPETWHFPYFNDEMMQSVTTQMDEADTMLLGRVTYEGFAAYWPTSDDEIAEHMNTQPKIVVSNTLEKAEWQNTTLVSGDVMAELAKIKQLPGKNLGVTGSVVLVRSLLEHGLLDELRLLLHPIVVGGTGQRLFEDGGPQVPLKLVSSKTFETGVLELIYAPADKPAEEAGE